MLVSVELGQMERDDQSNAKSEYKFNLILLVKFKRNNVDSIFITIKV